MLTLFKKKQSTKSVQPASPNNASRVSVRQDLMLSGFVCWSEEPGSHLEFINSLPKSTKSKNKFSCLPF